jgi:hypothetical protein
LVLLKQIDFLLKSFNKYLLFNKYQALFLALGVQQNIKNK